MCCQPLGNDVADTHSRAEAAIRVLENNLHLAAQVLEGVATQAVDALILKRDRPVTFRQPQQCQRQRGFARATLADYTHCATGVQCQTDPIHGFDMIDRPPEDAPTNAKPNPELMGFKEWLARGLGDGMSGFGFSFDECPGVLFRRRFKNLSRGARFHNPSVLHDVNPVCGFSYDAQIMSDEQQGHVEVSANLIE